MVNLPKKEQTEIDIFTAEEIRRFLEQLEKETLDYQVAYKLALFCGLRRSEMLGLKEDDVNLVFKTVNINKSRHVVDGREIVKSTKNETSRRILAVPDFLINDIKELIRQHHDVEYKHTDYLLQDGFGRPMTPSAVTKAIKRIEERAGLPDVSLHDLRHTFASMLNSLGVDIAVISRELGHSNINTTLGIYMHVFGRFADSSRGIADTLNTQYHKPQERAAAVPLLDKEKTADA